MLDELGIPYALGGSMASSMFGEPRATADVDLAIRLDPAVGDLLLARVQAEFYVPLDSAREAIRAHRSFNLLSTEQVFKVDLFALGDALLDRRQLERPGPGPAIGCSPRDLGDFARGSGVAEARSVPPGR